MQSRLPLYAQRFTQLNAQFSRSFSTAQPKVLLQEHSKHVVELRLNAPKALNAVDTQMCNDILTHVSKWNKEGAAAPKVCLMSGVGGKAFCAGGDIVSLYKAHKGDGDKSILKDFFAREYLLDYSLS